eukprot:379885_1
MWHRLCIFMCLAIVSQSKTIYVTKNGSDIDDCGESQHNGCGTFYFASIRASGVDSIFIHDGQNKDEINKYFKSIPTDQSYPIMYHPCLPIPWKYEKESSDHNVEITFNHVYIRTMDDWFMDGICYNHNMTINYYNSYLFEFKISQVYDIFQGHAMIINVNNLLVENFHADNIPFNLFYIWSAVENGLNSVISVICNECVFNHINSHPTIHEPTIVVDGNHINFQWNNCIFMNMHLDSLFESRTRTDYFSVEMYNTSIIDSTFYDSLFQITNDGSGAYTVSTFSYISMYQCKFINIETQASIIRTDELSAITILNTSFENILNGSIIQTYLNGYVSVPSQLLIINMNNIFISTSQLMKANPYGLFIFNERVNATINNINVTYHYDLTINCKYTYIYTDWVVILRTMPNNHYVYMCNHPVSFMHNYGIAQINGCSSFNSNILGFNESKVSKLSYVYPDSIQSAFIINYNEFHVKNVIFHDIVLGDNIFLSFGNLYLQNAILSTSILPYQMLQPKYIIKQQASDLCIDHCMLIGGRYGIIYSEGANHIYITNTVFKDSNAAMEVSGITDLVMNGSTIHNIGNLYVSNTMCHEIPVQIYFSRKIVLWNNTFSFYPQCGFAAFEFGQELILQNNVFVINYTGINVYNASFDLPRIMIGDNSEFSSVISNRFINNNEYSPWLYYFDNTGVNCLSGNEMDNYAIQLVNTNLTSCLRPELINCFNVGDFCQYGLYGLINKDIDYDTRSIFRRTHNISVIWNCSNNYMALDNVQIHNIYMTITQGNIFLLDSRLISDNHEALTDILYDNVSCHVIYNDRMGNNYHQIAKFAILCQDNHNGNVTLSKSMQAAVTKSVNHFSATTLTFLATDHEYWPGSVLYFNYSITDVFGNIVNYTVSKLHSTIHIPIIIIQNTNLSLLMGFSIDKYGKCDLCDAGITIFGANLLDSFETLYKINVTLDYEYLLLNNDHIYLRIVGCPIGYGATTNKYHCEKCSTSKFNLISNNTNECLSCDDHSYARHISQCSEYFASLQKYLYLLLLLIIPLIIICSVAIYCKQQYDKAFVVDKALVLIIGVSQFDKKTNCLPGVKQNVYDLVELWKDKYNYDVCVCNMETLYSNKLDIQSFIDNHKNKINDYKCVMVHVLSHGSESSDTSEDAFLSSDGKTVEMDFICHELICASDKTDLIKLIWNHTCRGTSNYTDGDGIRGKNKMHSIKASFNIHTAINSDSDSNRKGYISEESNLVIISGNVKGRTLSDSGKFTECIVESFEKNLEKIIKADFNSLFVEIGNNLEKRNKHAELCHMSGTFRFNFIRFEKCKPKETAKNKKKIIFDSHSAELEQSLLDANDYPL